MILFVLTFFSYLGTGRRFNIGTAVGRLQSALRRKMDEFMLV